LKLAIFDLDNTLIGGDSDHSWGEFLVNKQLVDVVEYKRHNDQFYEDYKNGNLDMLAYQEFALSTLGQFSTYQLEALHNEFMRDVIAPLRLPKADALIDEHRQAGHELLIITATNRFITEPIALSLGIENLLATDAELIDNKYSGKVEGVPCYQEGKITKLKAWLDNKKQSVDCSWFYSDSANDIPLLSQVDKPIAVNPDEKLKKYAEQHDWPVISLR